VDDLLASTIFARHGGIHPTYCRPLFLVAGARRVDSTKWFVPGGFQVSSGDGVTVELGVRAFASCSSAATP
jgi:hypothetical protein